MSEYEIACFGETTMTLALIGLPVSAILCVLDLKHTVALLHAILVVSSVAVAVFPSEDTISVIIVVFKSTLVVIAVWIYYLSLTIELSILEVSLVSSSICQC